MKITSKAQLAMWPENMHVLLLESRSVLVVVEFICLACYLCAICL